MLTSDARQRDYWERDHGFRRFDHPVVKLFAEQRLDLLATWIDFSRIRTALDVGCGDGFSTYYARRRIECVHATDRSRVMLLRHPLKNEGHVVSADAGALPYRDRSFDLVYGWEILHHVADPVHVVAEMARVSRRLVLVIEPNRNHPAQFAFALVDREHRWVLRYSRRFLENVCRTAGLCVLRSASGGHIFPNRSPLWMARLAARWRYKSPIGISNWVLAEKP
ncbi:MAG TPA: class I SAM-dependent methyltransferase [Vicinamibacterales bacterium]|nr:class I SAM-dependent methyltransferase [Vicinamibacterales bacterium]